MQFNHRNNDFPIYYDRPSPEITQTRKRSPTPIKIGSMRLLPSKENIPKSNSSRNLNDFHSANCISNGNLKLQFPARKAKPMISPSRHHFPENRNKFPEQRNNFRMFQNNSMLQSQRNQKFCPNHVNKLAQFMIQIEQEKMLYCQKCAVQLASQGFEITRIDVNQTVKKGECQKKTARKVQQQLPKYSQYEGSQMYEEIISFLKELNTIQQEHHENMDRFEEIDNHYNKQIKITENFYQQLLKTIQIMKEDHLSDLVEESRRHSQIADIEHDYLRQNVDEIDIIRKDIVNNLQVIMEKLEEDELYNNLNEYRQKIQVFRHKVEEQSEIFDQIINYTEDSLNQKQNLVQDYLMDVWADKENVNRENNRQQNKIKQNSHPPLPQIQYQQKNIAINKPVGMQQIQKKPNPNNPPAFRKLFDDEDNALISETSPQFKKI